MYQSNGPHSCDCEKLVAVCDECIKEYCEECKKNYCDEICKAGDVPEVCETCNIEEMVGCITCDLVEKLGCAECEDIRQVCIECPDVKGCDARR